MMKEVKELREKIAAKTEEMNTLLTTAKSETRSLKEEEVTKWDELDKEVRDLQKALEIEERQVELNKKIAAKTIEEAKKVTDKEKRDLKKYSLIKAMGSQLRNQKLEGLELEMHEEAVNEVRNIGQELEGLGVPSLLLQIENEKRDLEVGTTTAGGHLVQTTVDQTIPALRPKLQVQSMGATVLSGLRGNLDLPRNNGVGTATWEGEKDANAETTPTFDKISLTPNRLGAYTEYTKQLFAQAENESVEAFVRADLETAIRTAVDLAAINGSGSGNEPLGILGTTGIGSVAGGANGAVPSFSNVVGLETEIATDNADAGMLAYLTTPGIRGLFKSTEKSSSTGNYIWEGTNGLNGYSASVSTQVPSALTKGTSNDCHAIIFGNWSDLILANWAGLDIVVDPYSLSKNAKVQIIVNSWWDVAVRHAESFAAMQDAKLS